MSYLYVCEQGATIGVSDNRFNVEYKNGMIKSIPVETLEVIEVFGGVQVTTKCINRMLEKGSEYNFLLYQWRILWSFNIDIPCECSTTADSGSIIR